MKESITKSTFSLKKIIRQRIQLSLEMYTSTTGYQEYANTKLKHKVNLSGDAAVTLLNLHIY